MTLRGAHIFSSSNPNDRLGVPSIDVSTLSAGRPKISVQIAGLLLYQSVATCKLSSVGSTLASRDRRAPKGCKKGTS